MATGLEWQGFQRFDAGLAALAEFDAYDLMVQWGQTIVEGSRRGILSGIDGYGNPMPPLRYRFGVGKSTKNRRVPEYGTTRHAPGGGGLSHSEYENLTGPRLAPRGDASRVIKNLHIEIRHFADLGRWEVIGAWLDVVSKTGVPFLPFHFEGAGRNPKYDLRPVREPDLRFCENALRAFVRSEYLSRF